MLVRFGCIATRQYETSISIVLEHVSAELSAAHRELYPERIPEHIPFGITLLYPWLPAATVTEDDLRRLRSFFAGRPPLDFALTRVGGADKTVAFAVPEPDGALRSTMQALWALYPECPPYGRPGSSPSPHATLTRYANPANATFEQAKARVEPLLPVRCVVTEAVLREEYEPDRMRVRETFEFGSAIRSADATGGEAGRERIPSGLAAEAKALAGDPTYLRDARETAALMGQLRDEASSGGDDGSP